MATITVQLDDEASAFLAQQVAEGRYPDEVAAVRGGIRALQRYEHEHMAKQAEMYAAIQEGFESGVAEGDVVARVRARTGLPPRASRG